jgi:squalene-associated FAD-dependent desaturase
MSRDVVVVGGGLAGITAALRCADAGHRVTLLEAKPRLGGLTYSFRRGGLDVDNGQHVFLRCCTAYRRLLDRLGVAGDVTLQERLDIAVRTPDGRAARLRRTNLPAPLHLSGSMLRYGLLTPAQRVRFARAALAMRRLDRTDPAVDARSFADWLAEHDQDRATIDAMWELVGIATLNAHADETSLALAAMVFQVGMLTETAAADIGWSRVPLQRLHGDAAMSELIAAGATVRLGTPVEAITDDRRVRTRGDEFPADDVILAVPAGAAARLLPSSIAGASEACAALGTSPIINVHVVVDRPVLDRPFLAGVGTPIQWVFDRTGASGLTGTGQYLAVSVSAADAYIDLTVATLRERLLPDMVALLPALARATVVDFFVTRERTATFRPRPGSGAVRPGAVTNAAGLFLAGAWTDTGWPATMEGAVRSGEAAADAVMTRPVRQGVAT